MIRNRCSKSLLIRWIPGGFTDNEFFYFLFLYFLFSPKFNPTIAGQCRSISWNLGFDTLSGIEESDIFYSETKNTEEDCVWKLLTDFDFQFGLTEDLHLFLATLIRCWDLDVYFVNYADFWAKSLFYFIFFRVNRWGNLWRFGGHSLVDMRLYSKKG